MQVQISLSHFPFYSPVRLKGVVSKLASACHVAICDPNIDGAGQEVQADVMGSCMCVGLCGYIYIYTHICKNV